MPTLITDDHVIQARWLAANGKNPVEIARRCGLEEGALISAVRGSTFQHITDPAPVPGVESDGGAGGSDRGGGAGVGRVRLDGARLRAARLEMGMSQSVFALALQRVCEEFGERMGCSKRLVQRWEAGEHGLPLPIYQRAIAQVTRRSFASLCVPVAVLDASEAVRLVVEIVAEYQETQGRIAAKLMELHALLTSQRPADALHP